MSRPKLPPDSVQKEADVLQRHGEVWAYYQQVFDADPQPRGRATRAIKACEERFGIERSTVQRKLRAMAAVAASTRELNPMFEAAGIEARDARSMTRSRTPAPWLRKLFADINAAVAAGHISPRLAQEMRNLSGPAVREILRLCDKRRK